MSWGSYWISPWVFFGPIVTLLLMMVCMAGMFFMTRVGTIHHSSAEIGPIGPSFGVARNSGDSPLLEKYRHTTLARFDQRQREVHGKAKSDRLMAERRNRLLSCG